MTGLTPQGSIGTNNAANTVHASNAGVVVQAHTATVTAALTTNRVPQQLPGLSASRVVDRIYEVQRLTDALLLPPGDPGSRATSVAVLIGPGGCGKSTVALRWGRAHTDRFPDGQLYTDLAAVGSGPGAVNETLGWWLMDLGVDLAAIPPGAVARAALLRTLVHGKALLAVIDGADSATDIRPLLLASEASATVITSRVELVDVVAAGAEPIRVPALPTAAAVELLRGRAGDRADSDRCALDTLVRACGGHAATISLAAALLALHPHWPVAQLLRTVLTPDQSPTAVTRAWEAMLMAVTDDLPDAARDLFGLIGRLPRPTEATSIVLGVDAAAALLDCPPDTDTIRDALACLVEHGLMHESATPGRYAVPAMALQRPDDLVRAPDESAAANALQRLAEHCLVEIARAVETIEPEKARHTGLDSASLTRFADAPSAVEWVRAELPLLLAVFRECQQRGWDELVVRQGDVFWPVLRHLGEHDLQLQTQTAATSAAEHSGHPYLSLPRSRAGWALIHLDRPHEAVDWCTRGLDAASLCPRPHFAAAAALSTRSSAYAALGRYELALRDIDQAMAEDWHDGSPSWVRGLRERRKAHYLLALGRHEQALRVSQDAIAHTAPDQRRPVETARAWYSDGEIRAMLGLYTGAVDSFTRALDLLGRHPRPLHQAQTHQHLAAAYAHLGMPTEAAHHTDRARAIYRDAGRADQAEGLEPPAPQPKNS